MRVYDFDHTLYHGECIAHFYLFCLRRFPSLVHTLPRQLSGLLHFALTKNVDPTRPNHLYHFLRFVPTPQKQAALFWQSGAIKKIYPYYLKQHRPDDVVVTASPEFLVAPACELLGITHLIGSPVDAATGEFYGPYCYKEEKPRAFFRRFPGATIKEFYSDSLADQPMADVAEKAFYITKGVPTPWPKKRA